MTPIIVIPARMAATRLPGKPLAEIGGQAMVVRVYGRARKADVGPVVVAAGDAEIASAVRAVGGAAVLTDPELPSGSDRVLAALEAADPDRRYDTVVNLQGDMPFVDEVVIKACVELLRTEPTGDIATVVAPESSAEDRTNPDVVKAVLALDPARRRARALYFTRSTLYGDGPIWRHVGLYAYRRTALTRFCGAPPSELELRERLEQLRALEMGLSIHAAVVATAPLSVDTPADLAAARVLVGVSERAS
jgi:3-deoxy-manno-octulosonate cytidylyltransferase (CMP-KDO synthetase)